MVKEEGVRLHLRKLGLILAAAAAMAGCSADPYKGRTPAPPDRLTAPATETTSNPGATGSVPIGDGSESAAPNYSGSIPRVTGER
jgi:poly(3-hydroxybutyrate) depolymerase